MPWCAHSRRPAEDWLRGSVRFFLAAFDRACLAAIVLADRDKLATLEKIVHPAVREARERFVAEHPQAAALLFEIPLLFETAGEGEFDKIVVVSAPPEVQRARVLRRTGMTAAKLGSILVRQMPDAEKRAKADFVIDTGTDLSTTEKQVRDILACLGISPSR
jgi:dephospho-CoA kinase